MVGLSKYFFAYDSNLFRPVRLYLVISRDAPRDIGETISSITTMNMANC